MKPNDKIAALEKSIAELEAENARLRESEAAASDRAYAAQAEQDAHLRMETAARLRAEQDEARIQDLHAKCTAATNDLVIARQERDIALKEGAKLASALDAWKTAENYLEAVRVQRERELERVSGSDTKNRRGKAVDPSLYQSLPPDAQRAIDKQIYEMNRSKNGA